MINLHESMGPAGIELTTPGSAVRHISAARHVTDCTKPPVKCLYLGSIGMDHVISESCCKGTIIQRNYRKNNIIWSFSYNSFVKFHGKKK